MTETVVHVNTIEEWKAVLDVWFEQGYSWPLGGKEYSAEIFENGGRFLFLDDCITYSRLNFNRKKSIEYADFLAQQKEDNKMETYYVTKEQLDLIEYLKSDRLPFYNLVYSTTDEMKDLAQDIPNELDSKILRYIGGDETIEFKVKETLYRLWAIDKDGDKTYFDNYSLHAPATDDKYSAFTAPLEEIKKWQTPAWDIEKAD